MGGAVAAKMARANMASKLTMMPSRSSCSSAALSARRTSLYETSVLAWSTDIRLGSSSSSPPR
eukprot:7209833-Pyramimonas_sp.AAC.1